MVVTAQSISVRPPKLAGELQSPCLFGFQLRREGCIHGDDDDLVS